MNTRCLVLCLAAVISAAAQADSTAGPMVGPPIQRITTASAVSTEPLGAVTSVRELPDGWIVSTVQVRNVVYSDRERIPASVAMLSDRTTMKMVSGPPAPGLTICQRVLMRPTPGTSRMRL